MGVIKRDAVPVRDFLGGLFIALGGMLWLLAACLQLWDPILLSGFIVSMASDVLLLAGALVLALGLHGSRGVAGSSAAGKIALIIFGAASLVIDIENSIGASLPFQPGAFSIALVINQGSVVVFAVAAVVAAIAVVRAHELSRPAEAAFCVAAAIYVAGVLLSLFGSIAIEQAIIALRVQVIALPAAMVLFGLATLFQSKRKYAERGQ